MGYRINTTYHYTEAEARAAQWLAIDSAIPGYSEVFGRGVAPCRVINPATKEEVDGWKSETEEYYG